MARQTTDERQDTGVKSPERKNGGRHPNKKRKKYRTNGQRIFSLAVFLVFLFTAFFMLLKSMQSPSAYEAKKSLSDIAGSSAVVSKYYTYGNHFNLQGSLTLSGSASVEDVCLVFREAGGDEKNYDLAYEIKDGKISFKTSTLINEGIALDDLQKGNYFLLIKVTGSDKKSSYYSLENDTDYKALEYYTVTKNGRNNKITIAFGNFENDEEKHTYLNADVEKCSLPDDVYDVVIDAGHGGTDTGAMNGKYNEAEITLKYAKALKKSLEKLGLKVKLTRDGTESRDAAMALTMYDEDGRVNVACASKAKYCFSIHLNSNEESLKNGGLQIYCNDNLNTDFAANMAKNIVDETGISYSTMKTYKVAQGVYVRNFTEQERAESAAAASTAGYDSYNVTADTNYYFMIRELGGITTNAYIDGRNTKYGKNKYYDCNYGIESYLLELGFISQDKDLRIIINKQDDYIKALTESLASELGIKA